MRAVDGVEGVGAVQGEDGVLGIFSKEASQQVCEDFRAVGRSDCELMRLQEVGDGWAQVSKEAGGDKAVESFAYSDRSDSSAGLRQEKTARVDGVGGESELGASGEVDDVSEEVDCQLRPQ